MAADPASADWGSRLFVSCEPEELVGWGGFKGPPRDGVVELGYEIAESRRERGLATAATLALLAEAFAEPQVVKVIAHTLAEHNASNRVLEKAGFRFDRETQEEGQPVWRFALDRPAAGVTADHVRHLPPAPRASTCASAVVARSWDSPSGRGPKWVR